MANPATRLIYHPAGRAGEFAEVACNPYKGCAHACAYCYVPLLPPYPARADFHRKIAARQFGNIERELAFKSDKAEWTHTPVLFSFTTDPYQPLEAELEHTRSLIRVIKSWGFAVNILTKNPAALVLRDLDLLNPLTDMIGTTLTTMSIAEASRWEPGSPTPTARVTAMHRLSKKGFFTWVSLEPIIQVSSALAVLEATAPFVAHYKAGLLNYASRLQDAELREIGRTMERAAVAQAVVERLEDYGYTAAPPNTWQPMTYLPKETIREFCQFPNLPLDSKPKWY